VLYSVSTDSDIPGVPRSDWHNLPLGRLMT
jgi:hypothetical protein